VVPSWRGPKLFETTQRSMSRQGLALHGMIKEFPHFTSMEFQWFYLKVAFL
jgi:hypothetical protein